MKIGEQIELEKQLGRRPTSQELDQIDHFCRKTIKGFANLHLVTDVYPYEVVKKISENCVEVKEMKATQTVFPKEVHVGGFSAHTSDNDNQQYIYESDPETVPIRIRWSDANSCWRSASGSRFIMSDKPYKFYDYNF